MAKEIIEGKVLQVIDDYKLVINKGKRDNVHYGQIFLIYHLSKDDMIDEDTGENLGKIEYVIGKGKVVHLQEAMATIESTETVTTTKKTIKKSNNILGMGTEETVIEPDEQLVSFERCEKGYLARSLT